MAELPEEECSGGSRPLPLDESVGERVLGLNWDLKTNHICVKVKIPDKPLTRRGILSMSHFLFDPLGVVAPVLLEQKLLLRELKNIEWDEQITEVEAKRWESWLASLHQLENLQLSRCINPTKLFGSLKYELHHFSDASSIAYGAVSYLRIEDERANVHCTFVMGKCHLAPSLTTTIP